MRAGVALAALVLTGCLELSANLERPSFVRGDAGARDVESYLAQALEASCREHVRCRDHNVTPVQGDIAICHPAWQAREAQRVREALAAGDVRFDEASAERVLASLVSSPPCSEQRATLLGVDRAFEPFAGTRPAGARCEWAAVCESGRCDPRTRRCAAVPALGEPCLDALWDMPRCARELRCDDATRRCVDGLPEGSPGCGWSTDCAPGLTCVSGGECALPLERGAACGDVPTRLSRCREGLVCTAAGCGDGGGAGARCSRDLDGVDPCARGLHCGEEDRCVRLSRPGGPCSADDECPFGFACDGRCVALPVLGEQCSRERPCLEGTCDGSRCVPSAIGSACADEPYLTTPATCEAGAFCDVVADRCTPLRDPGERCHQDHHCVSNRCERSSDHAPGRCRA